MREVCATVRKATEIKELELSLLGLSRKILCAGSALTAYISEFSGVNRRPTETTGRLAELAKLVDSCISDLVKISNLPGSPLREITLDIPGGNGLAHTFGVSDHVQVVSGSPASLLTRRERQVTCLLAQGKSNKEAAGALGISVRTVETHRAKIMFKLRIHSIGGLVLFAVRNKMIDPSKSD